MLRIFRELHDKMISLKDIAQTVRLRVFKKLHNSGKNFPTTEYSAIYANAHLYMTASICAIAKFAQRFSTQ